MILLSSLSGICRTVGLISLVFKEVCASGKYIKKLVRLRLMTRADASVTLSLPYWVGIF